MYKKLCSQISFRPQPGLRDSASTSAECYFRACSDHELDDLCRVRPRAL